MNQNTRIPSPECPGRDEDHAEHMFKLAFVMNQMAGAWIDCPGKGA